MTLRIKPRKVRSARSTLILRWSPPLLLFLAGVSALGYCGYVMAEARISQNEQSREFDQAMRDAHAFAASDAGAAIPAMPAFVEARSATPAITAAKSGESIPVGRIEISSIGLTAMIQEGTGYHTLQRGVGHITGTSLPGQSGNTGLAGHRDTFFRKLKNIHEGDEIRMTTLSGSFLYRVDLISIVEPQDSAVLRSSGTDVLTLVTCYPFSFVGPAPKRFVVRASEIGRVESQFPDDEAPRQH